MEKFDDLFDEAKKLILDSGKISAALLQRKLRIGYARAAKILDQLQEAGIISEPDGPAMLRTLLVGHKQADATDEDEEQAAHHEKEATELEENEKREAIELGAYDAILPDENNQPAAKKIERDKVGRPTVMTRQTIRKLREAFLRGYTDREACYYAHIAPSTLYDFCLKNPEFSEQKEAWKDNPVLMSRDNIYKSIKSGAVQDSWPMLRAKRKLEFADTKIDIPVEQALTLDQIEDLAKGKFEFIGDKEPADKKTKKPKKK